MWKQFSISLLLLIGICATQAIADTDQTPVNPLLGSWKLRSVSWHSESGSSSIEPAQPGLFLFTPRSYSIMWTPTRSPRTPFEVLSKPTDAEAIAGFKSVVFNGGSYEFKKHGITTQSYIAKVPGFEGGLQMFRYKIDGDVLRLTMFDEVYPDGSKPDWSGVWKTEFVLTRVQPQ